MSEHELELVSPIYGTKGTYTAFCTCGWASEELPTAGKATGAGWRHVNAAEKAKPKSEQAAS